MLGIQLLKKHGNRLNSKQHKYKSEAHFERRGRSGNRFIAQRFFLARVPHMRNIQLYSSHNFTV